MKRNLLQKEIERKFELNEIQNKAVYSRGKNLIFDAPTASGKTEAILLSIEEGSNVTWMLPTISACTFMYRRLCHDFKNLNVQVSTSTMEETRFLKEGLTRINIITCDPFMVDYMRELVTNNIHKMTTDEVIVLDEIDNYPVKVRTALKHYMKNVTLKQVILASATLDDELKEAKRDFELIQFSKVSNKIRYKSLTLDGYREAVKNVIKPNYRKKRIGVISNCVKYMENMRDIIQEVMGVDCYEDMNVIYHHSSLPNEIKFENERRLFEGEYDLLVSNDLVSMSVDVDLDILIMDWSDKMNVNIQRMGRLNRKGKRVTFKNLFIIDDGVYPPFIEKDMAEYLLEDLELEEGSSRIITSDLISEWSERISLEDYSFDALVDDVKYAINHDEEILLRDVPLVFRYEEIRTVQKRKKGKKIEAERKLMTVDKRMNSIPWIWDTPCSEEDGEKDLVYMPWLYNIDHPSGEYSSAWMIVSYNQESGIRTIVPYTGPQYEYYRDREDEEDIDDVSEYTHDEDGAFTGKGGWFSPEVIFNEKNEKFMKYPEQLYSYEIHKRKTIFEKYNDEEKTTLMGVIRDYYNRLLHYSKEFSFKDCDKYTMNSNGIKILNYFAKDTKMNPVTLLKETCYAVREYGMDSLKSQQAAIWLRVDNEDEAYLGYNHFWLALHPELKRLFIKEFEPKIRKVFGNLDYRKINLEYEGDEENGDIPIRFTYDNLTYDIPKLFIQDVWLGVGEEEVYDEDNETIRRELELMGYYDEDDDDE